MNGLRKAALYSLTTNKLGYCGPKESFMIFEDFIINGSNSEKVKQLLERFEGLYPYLQVIAEKNALEPFDKEVIEAYWLGNKLLDKMNSDDIKAIISKLCSRGLPKIVADKLMARIPANSIPHHSFNVIFVGVGTVTGSVPANIKNMNSCLINWGKVIGTGKQLTVETQELKFDRKYYFQPAIKFIDYNKKLLPEIKLNDYISFHWNTAVENLTIEQKNNLERYTLRGISAVNQQ